MSVLIKINIKGLIIREQDYLGHFLSLKMNRKLGLISQKKEEILQTTYHDILEATLQCESLCILIFGNVCQSR